MPLSSTKCNLSFMMAMARILLISILFVASTRPVVSEDGEFTKPNIAVYEFQVRGDLGISDAGAIVAEWMIGALVATDRFTLMERVLLAHLIEEQEIQSSPLVDETKMASEMGRLYGVEAVVSGSVIQWDDTVSIVARLVDTNTGAIRNTAEISNGNRKNIRNEIDLLARKLAGLDPRTLPHESYRAKSVDTEMQLTVHPTRVTTGEEIAITAVVPPACMPTFINLSHSTKLTPIPLQYFQETDLGNGWRRYETSSASNSEYKIIVLDQDERGENKLGFVCEPTDGFQDKETKVTLLRDLRRNLLRGEMGGKLSLRLSEPISYMFSKYTID